MKFLLFIGVLVVMQSTCGKSPYVFQGAHSQDGVCLLRFSISEKVKRISISSNGGIYLVSNQSKLATSTDKYSLWVEPKEGGYSAIVLKKKGEAGVVEEIGVIKNEDLDDVLSKCPFVGDKLLRDSP